MLKKLHLQMTFFCILITSLIMVIFTCLSLYIAESSNRKNSYASFQSNISSTLNYLENQSTISHQWIANMKTSYGFIIDIRDNGTPLFFHTLNRDDYPEDVLSQAALISRDEYALNINSSATRNILSQSADFALTAADGQDYYAATALLPKADGCLSVIILYSLAGEQRAIIYQRILFALICFAAMLLLGVFAWFFTKRMIQPIKESKQRQTQFIASASHELRSPLTVMLSSLSAMRIAAPADADAFANTIASEGHRMSRLIDDMLILANADNGSWSISPEKVDLDTLLMQTYEKYEPLAAKRHLTLSLKLPDAAIPPCRLDGERIAQVLSILIDNAFSYTPAGGEVALGLDFRPGKFTIYVSDNGPGISAENKELIFERFYRIDKAHHAKSHFGLGLCIAAEIIKLHNGRIAVTDSPDGGATFNIYLPSL